MLPFSSPSADASPSQSASAPFPPTRAMEKKLIHKSDLNCYCQKLGIPLPVYQTVVEGLCGHALRFRSTVSVGKRSFTSSITFVNRKSAEQDAAKLALEHLVIDYEATATNLRTNLRKLVCEDKARCKMIVNEFADKIKMKCAYVTIQVNTPPLFVSTLALNGKCYKGEACKSKKEAEQVTALVAILSLLDDPSYGTLISEVIKSKFKSDAFYEAKDCPNIRDCSFTNNGLKMTTFNSDVTPFNQQASPIEQSSSNVLVSEQIPTSVTVLTNHIEKQKGSGILIDKNNQDSANSLSQTKIIVNKNNQDFVNSMPQTEKQDDGVDNLHTEAVTILRCSYVNLPITSPLLSESQHEIKLPEVTELASHQISVPPPVASPSMACDLTSSKKRRKNKKKANKRLRAENK